MDYLIGILVFALMMGLILSPLMFHVMITNDTNKMEKDKLKREEGRK